MNTEMNIAEAVRIVSTKCNVEGPKDVTVRIGTNYASGYDKRSQQLYFERPVDAEPVKAQNPFLHEAGHLVRLHNQRILGVGHGLVEELDRVSKLVDTSANDRGVLGEHFFKLWSLWLEKHASDELVGCYFGMDFDDQDVVTQAVDARSLATLDVFRKFQQEWKKEIEEKSDSPLFVNQYKTYLDFAMRGGKNCGGMLGHILAVEGANPRGVMLHDPTKLFASIEKLSTEMSFPANLESFLQGTKLLGIPAEN